jgi:hypothetical protein
LMIFIGFWMSGLSLGSGKKTGFAYRIYNKALITQDNQQYPYFDVESQSHQFH